MYLEEVEAVVETQAVDKFYSLGKFTKFAYMRSRVEVLKLIRLIDGCYDRIPVRKQQSINIVVRNIVFQLRVMSRWSLQPGFAAKQ